MKKLFEMNLSQDLDIELLSTDVGDILLSRNSGGSFKGKRIAGIVHPMGMSIAYTPSSGHNDVKGPFLLETDDGAKALMDMDAFLEISDPEIGERIANGEEVKTEDYYFKGKVRFHVDSDKYRFLERKLFSCDVMIKSYADLRIVVYEI